MDPRLANLDVFARRPRTLYEEKNWWGQQPLWSRVRDVSRATPNKPAVIDESGRWSYAELWNQARRIAAAMRASGLGRRDIALVQLPNWREYVAVAVAAEIEGVAFAFCPIQWGLRETARALNLIQPRLWVTTAVPRAGDARGALIRDALAACEHGRPHCVVLRSNAEASATAFTDWLASAPASVADDTDGASGQEPLEIAVTSGSTGDPKGVLHVHDTGLATVQSTIRRQGIRADDVVHLAIPVGHTFGYFYGVRCAFQARGTLVLQERWDARRMLELVRAHGVTVSLGPSAFLLDLLNLSPSESAALSGIRLFTHSGDSLAAPTMRRAMETFPFRISRALGMTEFGHAVSTDAATPIERNVDSVGTPQPEIELRIVDHAGHPVAAGVEGRILVRGAIVFAGYLLPDRLNQDVLDADGFFDTGDLGYLDEGGYLHMTGRLKAVIRRGAETVPVSLLEDLIASLPQVAHVVVVGLPDERMGELPVACVQLRRTGAQLTMNDVTRVFEANAVTKKFWPASLRFFNDWPIGPTGKIDRKMVLERILQQGSS